MRAYIRAIVERQIKTLFEGADVETVLSWWIANEGRRPVVVVGAGFSRNAQNKKTKEPARAADVPLWGEVARAFADDLRIQDPIGIDPLTLAELHRDGVGERRFVDMLRELLPDDDLAPSDAHKALFNFDLEAIVTTNFLDTLLDRDPRCVPIFDDTDVARRIDKPGKIEVLYFHGHRSAPTTWVASRSQYEDVGNTRPMLLTRVRQLLSQHPVLTVGYSLADPDFHQIYRQISLDMKTTNPLGLALLGPASSGEKNSEQESSFRRHWERQGLRIARFKDWDDLNTKFANFFGMTNRITVDELKSQMDRPGQSFAQRIQIAKSAFEDPKIEKYVETYRGWQNAVWRQCIEAEFERSEIDELKEKARRVWDAQFGRPAKENEVRISMGGNGAPSSTEKKSIFQDAPFFMDHHIRQDWDLGLRAYRWLDTRRSSGKLLAEWLSYRVEHEYWDQRDRSEGDADIDVATLLGAVWRTIDARTEESSDRAYRREAIRQLNKAHQFLVKYGAKEQAEILAADIVAFGGEVEFTKAKPPELSQMEEAFGLMMNGEFVKASEMYGKALEKAECGDDPLLPWLAAWGRHDAYFRETWNLRSEDKDAAEVDRREAIKKEFWRARKKYGEHSLVVAWQEEADRRLNELRKRTIEQLQKKIRDGKYERHGGFSFSDTPHFAWRIFRDLETRHAPPGLQEQYLKPLLDHGVFDLDENLQLRLQFGIEKTREWLDAVLDESRSNLTEAQEINRKLVAVWKDSWKDKPVIKTTLAVAMDVTKPLLEVLEVGDASLPVELLRKVKSELRHHVENHRGSRVIGHDLEKAWRNCACVLRNKESYEAFREYAQDTADGIADDELYRRMGELPWYSWMILGIASPDELVGWLCKYFGREQRAKSSYRTPEGVGNALLQVLGNLDSFPPGLSKESWALVAQWYQQAFEGKPSKDDDDVDDDRIDWLGSTLNVITIRAKQKGERGDDATWQEIENKAFDKLSAAWARAIRDSGKGIHESQVISIFWCLAIIMEKNDERWNALAEKAWETLVAQWERILQFVKNNPFRVSRLGWFLATVIEHDFKGHRQEAGNKLLEIGQVSSSIHRVLPRILDPHYWPGESWAQVVDLLREGLGGARGEFSSSWRMAISTLLRQTLLNRKDALPDELWFLVDHVALLVANEEAIVANHAAYTAVFCSELCTDDEGDRRRVMLMEKTLEAMARDTRMPVRQGAAYASGRLPLTAKSKTIKECAKRIRETLEKESYLMLETQIKLGEAEAKAKMREDKTPSTE